MIFKFICLLNLEVLINCELNWKTGWTWTFSFSMKEIVVWLLIQVEDPLRLFTHSLVKSLGVILTTHLNLINRVCCQNCQSFSLLQSSTFLTTQLDSCNSLYVAFEQLSLSCLQFNPWCFILPIEFSNNWILRFKPNASRLGWNLENKLFILGDICHFNSCYSARNGLR